ncbi:MAG: GspE/PulE family protein [Phycisphaeraceae bacterium]
MRSEPQTAKQMIDLSDLPVERAVDRVIAHALRLGASDLMLLANEDFYALHVRHLGLIRPVSIVSADLGRRFSQHIKAAAGMDVAEHRHPHDGRWIYDNLPEEGEADAPAGDGEGQDNDGVGNQTTPERMVDLRISTVPTMHGEDMVIRLLSRRHGLFKIDQIGLSGKDQQRVESMLDSPGGLVLCCGPTGSGKTATLYAALNHLNNGTRKINTIEDPIEFTIEGLRQSQVNPKIGLDFAQLLKGVLRQSPDMIMIGEIRDRETATTAVHAANAGHLVLSTIHAPVAAAAIESMRSLGVNNHFLATALRGVLSQRLVRTLDKQRRVEYDISHAPQVFEPIKHLLGEDEGKTFYAPGAAEGETGYSGRTGVFEVMTMSNTLRDMISHGADTHKLRGQARKEGILDFKANALLKVARGETSIEEVFRVVPAEYLEED